MPDLLVGVRPFNCVDYMESCVYFTIVYMLSKVNTWMIMQKF